MKANVDGAMARSLDKGGGGVVIRDHNGRFLTGACHFFPALLDLKDGELRACRRALELIKEMGFSRV